MVLSLAVTCSGGRCGDDDAFEWKLSWVDEFEGPAGQLPDSSKWRFDVGGDGWGNEQLEYDTNRAENVSLDGNGNLAITAREETYKENEEDEREWSYTSGRINTRDLFDQANGRFEARIKLPVGQGVWPAFWLLGENFEEVGWPECGEIDIMEYRGQDPRTLHGSLHGPGYSGGGAVTGRFTLPEGAFNDDFHIFAVEWDGNRITWFMDDTDFFTVLADHMSDGTRWVFDHPFFIILNVAIGGHFVGPPDDSTTFPQTMLVDWVRVYGLER